MFLFFSHSHCAFIPPLLFPFLSAPLTWLLSTNVMYSKYYSTSSPCLLLHPPPHVFSLPFILLPSAEANTPQNLSALPPCVSNSLGATVRRAYICLWGCTLLPAAVKSCFSHWARSQRPALVFYNEPPWRHGRNCSDGTFPPKSLASPPLPSSPSAPGDPWR